MATTAAPVSQPDKARLAVAILNSAQRVDGALAPAILFEELLTELGIALA